MSRHPLRDTAFETFRGLVGMDAFTHKSVAAVTIDVSRSGRKIPLQVFMTHTHEPVAASIVTSTAISRTLTINQTH